MPPSGEVVSTRRGRQGGSAERGAWEGEAGPGERLDWGILDWRCPWGASGWSLVFSWLSILAGTQGKKMPSN